MEEIFGPVLVALPFRTAKVRNDIGKRQKSEYFMHFYVNTPFFTFIHIINTILKSFLFTM